ncbi:MAG: alpha/beta hydrolase [Reichenbachiella sp.]
MAETKLDASTTVDRLALSVTMKMQTKPNGLKLYCIPGLGLNSHIFDKLDLDGYDVNFIEWIEPEIGESICNYAKRISEGLGELNTEIILIGHSFGGVLAQEISNYIEVKLIFLISSIKSPQEIPLSLRLLARFRLHKFVSRSSILLTFPLWAYINGYVSRTLKLIFKKSITALSSKYLQWSLKEISNWEGIRNRSTPIIQIHGNSDLTFPIKMISNPSNIIKKGDHLMVYRRAQEIKSIIEEKIKY